MKELRIKILEEIERLLERATDEQIFIIIRFLKNIVR